MRLVAASLVNLSTRAIDCANNLFSRISSRHWCHRFFHYYCARLSVCLWFVVILLTNYKNPSHNIGVTIEPFIFTLFVGEYLL